jgi:hypothetical protein
MRLQLPDRGERGAIAVLTAFLTVVLFAAAALGVDITTQVNQRQQLHDTIDAAAHAGAYDLPASGTHAQTDAVANALINDPAVGVTWTPTVVFYCVVASVAGAIDTTQIPSTCNPSSHGTAGFRCNAKICSIPCFPAAGDVCNTISVSGTKPVPFSFAPVIGINQGGTGSVTSVACKGSCGTIPPNPMDVAVVADRTGSMSGSDITAMITGIESMFQVMTPAQQYVSLGTLGRSAQTPYSHTCGTGSSSSKALSQPSTSATAGPWIPVPFSNNYLSSGTLNQSSDLVAAVNCLKNTSSTATHLASAMKAAARYLLGAPAGYDPNNLGSLPAQIGTVRKAIIFETDGTPNESANSGTTLLTTAGDIENTNKITSCTNFTTVAAQAKAAGILVATVDFLDAGNDSTATCNGVAGTQKITDTLAAAASPGPNGPSVGGDCSTTAGQNAVNNDGDYFFCGGGTVNMASIFKTALGQLAKGIKFIQLP